MLTPKMKNTANYHVTCVSEDKQKYHVTYVREENKSIIFILRGKQRLNHSASLILGFSVKSKPKAFKASYFMQLRLHIMPPQNNFITGSDR